MRHINIKYLVVSCFLTIFLLSGVGCELLPSTDTPTLPEVPAEPSDSPNAINPGWITPTTNDQAPSLPSIADVVAKVKPSVVSINTEYTSYDFFNRAVTEEGAGSGWLINESGIIVTNNHVVEDAEVITVTLADGRTFSVDLDSVATDSITDLAVLIIDTDNLVAVAIGDPNALNVGDWVVAIGNSLNLGVTPSEGIIRSLGVSVPISTEQTLYGLIGTSAAINPGNSGGPLVNMRGEVVGITTIKISMVGVEGMGWAISTEIALPIIEELIQKGYVVRPWLGVSIQTVTPYLASSYRLAVDEGTLIADIVSGSPADQAGLVSGDILVRFNGEEVTTGQDLLQAIHAAPMGQEVEIIFWRGSSQKTAHTILVERPASN
ncbi:S1C family serine protease [Chloroflexota bacterium]